MHRAEELRDKLSKYGELRDCYLPRDFHTGRPRGFGFAEFAGDHRDADDAIRVCYSGRLNGPCSVPQIIGSGLCMPSDSQKVL